MAGDYRVYDHKGKSLTGKDSVDRQTATRLFNEEKRKQAGRRGSTPTIVRKGQEKEPSSRK